MLTYRDIQGDGGSDVLEQVVALRRQIADRLSGVRHVLAVGSGKGGVGKSTLALQLARALQRGGARVAILDADLNGPTQARLSGLGASPPVVGETGLCLPRTADGLGVLSLGALVPETQSVDFESVAEGDSHTWRATREFTLLAELVATVEWGAQDVLVCDLPPGPERTFQLAQFLGPRAAFVLVTLPSQVSRGVVARSLVQLRKARNPILGYVENMAGYVCGGCDSVQPLFPEGDADALDIPCLGRIPFDPRLAAAGDAGLASRPEGPTGRALDAVANSVLEALNRVEDRS